jgi:hypothetical protein
VGGYPDADFEVEVGEAVGMTGIVWIVLDVLYGLAKGSCTVRFIRKQTRLLVASYRSIACLCISVYTNPMSRTIEQSIIRIIASVHFVVIHPSIPHPFSKRNAA